jgi:hypothetical protein
MGAQWLAKTMIAAIARQTSMLASLKGGPLEPGGMVKSYALRELGMAKRDIDLPFDKIDRRNEYRNWFYGRKGVVGLTGPRMTVGALARARFINSWLIRSRSAFRSCTKTR